MNTEELEEFYKKYPDMLVENFLGFELKWYQKVRLRFFIPKWRKAIMIKFLAPKS